WLADLPTSHCGLGCRAGLAVDCRVRRRGEPVFDSGPRSPQARNPRPGACVTWRSMGRHTTSLDRGCRHSVNAQWAHPTSKSIRVDRFVVASARRNRPLLEAQLPSADEIKAWLHHRFRDHRHITNWTPNT